MEWRRGCNDPQAYGYSYDNLNRLSSATYGNKNGSRYTATQFYDVPQIGYDFDGNITNLQRFADVGGTATLVDDLNYTYGGLIKNRLTHVQDATNSGLGFNDMVTNSTANYVYDTNGNLTEDKHKGLDIDYNYLDLPTKADFIAINEYVEFTYTAAGEKLHLAKVDGNNTTAQSNYCNGIEYNENGLEAIYTAEGRVLQIGTTTPSWEYQYYLTDQVGNVRTIVRPIRIGEQTSPDETYKIVQEIDFYPFGLEFQKTSGENDYAFNSIEYDEDLAICSRRI
ncbi:MAG: hypothetical protein AAGI23_11955 [Bacteroidota bacterium]